ncbi:AK7 [Branchiostoma lanceolatum]|uniref:AK7 protein n=1 Tax=Branchiostoma lanceolatum TaxID=7740 RepID=A0A8J9ZXM6_BRALA|nr:AK7 [Branchiostoma lanceolatum]
MFSFTGRGVEHCPGTELLSNKGHTHQQGKMADAIDDRPQSKRIFVNHVDAYSGKNISKFLSDCVVGSSLEEGEEGSEGEEDRGSDYIPPSKEGTYTIIGTLQNPANAKPDWVKEVVQYAAKEELADHLMECDIIIYDITEDPDQIDEATWACSALHAELEHFDNPKMFILLSSVMTWAKSKPLDPDDPEIPFTEDDYRRRKPHPNFKNHISAEKLVIKNGKTNKGKFVTYVVAAGLAFGMGESIFHFLFKAAWEGKSPALQVFGTGTNIVPSIHIKDLAGVLQNICDQRPKTRYIVAVDDSQNTLEEIVRAIASNLGNGKVKKLSKEDYDFLKHISTHLGDGKVKHVTKEEALLSKDLAQADFDQLLVNLRMEAMFVKESMRIMWIAETGMCENIDTVIREYKQSRGLLPMRACIMGPPAVGKTTIAKKLCEHYKLHHIKIKDVIDEAVENLKRLSARADEGEEEEDDGKAQEAQELLDAIQESRESNNASGEEFNNITADEANRLRLHIIPSTTQVQDQAGIRGVCEATFHRQKLQLKFAAFVVTELAFPIIAGRQFLEDNGLTIDFATRQICFQDGSISSYPVLSKPHHPRVHRISDNFTRQHYTATNPVPNAFHMVTFPAQSDINPQVSVKPCSPPVSSERVKDSPWDTDYKFNITGYTRAPTILGRPIHTIYDSQVTSAIPASPAEADTPASADANRQVKGETQPSSPASADANRQVKGETQPSSPASADANRQVKGETQPSSADANRHVKGETQPSPTSADVNRQVKGETQPSPTSADANRQVKGETQPSPTSADANRQVTGETQPSPASADANGQVKGENQPSLTSADVNRQVKGENQPSPASADANRQVKGENQPSLTSADVNRQVKGENQPSPTSADANRQVKGETQPSPVPLHQCSPTEGEAETKQTVEVFTHSPTQGITSTPQVKEGQHSNTDADTLRVSEECKTLPPFPNTLQIQEKCQSSPKAAALSDTLQVQLLYQSPRDCPPTPPDHLDRQHPRDHPLLARAPDLPGYHHPAVRPPPEPPPRLLSQNPGHLRTHPQNFIS